MNIKKTLLALIDNQLLLVLLFGLALELGVDFAGERVGSQRPAEQQDVGLGLVAGIVLPAAALLDPQATPLRVRQSTILGQSFGRLLRQNDVTVLELAVLVLLRVLDLGGKEKGESVSGLTIYQRNRLQRVAFCQARTRDAIFAR